jgi:hypothetical protein
MSQTVVTQRLLRSTFNRYMDMVSAAVKADEIQELPGLHAVYEAGLHPVPGSTCREAQHRRKLKAQPASKDWIREKARG